MAGKGDRNRSNSLEFKRNYDKIFGEKCKLHHQHTKECPGYEENSDK